MSYILALHKHNEGQRLTVRMILYVKQYILFYSSTTVLWFVKTMHTGRLKLGGGGGLDVWKIVFLTEQVSWVKTSSIRFVWLYALGSLGNSIGIRHLYAQYFQCCCVDKDLLAYQTPQICLRNREKTYLYCFKKSPYRY